MSKKKHTKKHHKKLEKKEVHQEVHEAEHKKQHTKKETKEHKKSVTISPILKKIGNIVFIGGLIVFMISFLGFFIMVKMREPAPLAAVLPADDTVAFAEFHAAPFSNQREKLAALLAGSSAYDTQILIENLSKWLGEDVTQEVLPWVDTTAGGMAVLTSSQQDDMPQVYFLGVKDQQAGEAFFSTRILENEESTQIEDITIRTFPWDPEWRYGFVNRYLIIGSSEDALQRVIAVMKGQSRALRQSELWSQVDKNLPSARMGVGFINLERAVPFAAKIPFIVNALGRDFSILAPLTQIFPATGFTLSAEGDEIVMESFTMTRRSDGTTTFDLEEYEGVLTKNFPAAPLAFFGGENFTAQFDQFSQLFTTVHPSGAKIVQGMVRAQIEQLFGTSDLLESAIEPLLENEYGIGFFEGDNGINFVLQLSGDSDEILSEYTDTLKKNFVESGAVWQPVITEITLPDGTVGKEIQAQQAPIREEEIIVNGSTIHSLSFGTTTLFYTIRNAVLILTNSQALIEQIVTNQNDTSLENTLQPYVHASQEVTYVDLTQFFATLTEEETTKQFLKQYFAPFETMVMTKSLMNTGAFSVAHLIKAE